MMQTDQRVCPVLLLYGQLVQLQGSFSFSAGACAGRRRGIRLLLPKKLPCMAKGHLKQPA